MRLALVHDSLCGMGGAERVFEYMCEEFSEADIFTLAYQPEQVSDSFRRFDIRTTFMQPFMRNMEAVRWAFPFNTHVMQSLNLDSYDLVLTSSASIAKYIRTRGIHVCYCYIPTRALWQPDRYFGGSSKGKLMQPFLNHLRKRDKAAAQEVDHFIAISDDSAKHVSAIYDREAAVINCPIDTDRFMLGAKKEEHFLLVSRLEQWKRVDYAIEAFNILGLPLRIVGSGVEENALKAMAKSNIEFVGSVSDDQLVEEYSKARAIIFTPELEYGLITLEANACGTPVICLGKAGAREIMIGANEKANHGSGTAVFFYEQTKEALITAVEEFRGYDFDPQELREHALNWSIPEFKRKMRDYISEIGSNL
jgi:glycosyltransferase involved in cell wall biosynthesis